MRRADRLAAARALRHLVHAHRLVGPALTVAQARRAQTAASLRRLRMAPLRVAVAEDPAAAAARREARRAGRVPVFGADTLVRRAVLEPARRAEARVLVTRRLTVYATLGDAVLCTEVLRADRAAVRASLAAAVVVLADDERRRRAAALWTRHDPGGRTAQGPLRAEGRATRTGWGRLELPLGALHQDGRLDELQGMHDGLHLAAPDLFGAATLGERRDRSNGLRVGLLFEDRLEVAVQPSQLGGELLLRRGTARSDPLRRLLAKMAQDKAEQVGGFPHRDGCRGRRNRRIRGLDPARLQVLEHAGQIVTQLGTGRQVVHVAFHHRFLDPGPRAQHHARDEPSHRMYGQARRARLCRAVAYGNSQLDARGI